MNTALQTTERLEFRNWKEGDYALASEIWGDPEVMKYAGGALTPQRIAERIQVEISNFETFGIQYWPLFHKQDFIGCCGLKPFDPTQNIYELGFYIRKTAWGNGYAGEAAAAVIRFAFSAALTTDKLFAVHHPDNNGSKNVLQKLGFQYSHHQYFKLNDVEEPCYYLSK